MNRRKALSVIALAPLTGCAYFQKNPDRLGGLMEASAFNGTYKRLTEHPDDKPRFVMVREELRRQLDSGVFDPVLFSVTLQQLGVKEMTSPQATMIIQTVIILLPTGGEAVNLDTAPLVNRALIAVVKGMDTAIGLLGGTGDGGVIPAQ